MLCAAWVFPAMPTASAATDPRLQVEIPADETGRPTDVGALLARALPMLWDRIVPTDARKRADTIAPDARLLLRLRPGREVTTLEFHREAVFRALTEAHIPFIPEPPRIHLVIHVRNASGLPMPQTEALLMEQARRIAVSRGLLLTDNAPGLVLEWRWLTDREAMLNARGTTRLPEFSETRVIEDADPLPELARWLESALLRARDAHAFAAASEAKPDAASDAARVSITLRRDAPLATQVALEEALSQDPRVARLIPIELSRARQRYALWLNGDDDWLPDWFARRGYRLSALPDGGWLAE